MNKQISRGNSAERLLNNSLLKEAFREIEDNIHKKWADSKAADNLDRETLYYQLKALNAVREWLSREVNKGKIAQHKETK